ncbi:MAG: hypothetical protein KC656_32600 [Myxococcales bacterium]|nr:hypothetical protein [Myxococcales bacterium]
MQRFTEVLNDFFDLWVLADPEVLTRFQGEERLSDDLVDAFTRGDTVDRALAEGVLLPMSGIVNQPYTMVFRRADEGSVFGATGADLQVERHGYGLRVTSGVVGLITVPYLRRWNDEGRARLRAAVDVGVRQAASVDSGFYAVSVLGGMVADGATFEVVFDEVAEDSWALAARAEATFVIG